MQRSFDVQRFPFVCYLFIKNNHTRSKSELFGKTTTKKIEMKTKDEKKRRYEEECVGKKVVPHDM